MPIDFSCPKCAKKYRVKDELAGKTAKCAQCSERIQIPAGVSQASRAAPPTASPKPAAAPKPAATAPTKTTTSTSSSRSAPAAKSDDPLSSWFDAELKSAPASAAAPAAKSGAAAGKLPTPPKRSEICPSCRVPLPTGAAICVACGYDVRKGQKLATKKGDDGDAEAASKKRSAIGATASFGRGVLFSIIGALLGASIWAGVAIALHVEIGYVAVGLGALAGLGMAFGHEDKDGTMAGIAAAGISIVGILAAKFFILQYFRNHDDGSGVTLAALEQLSGKSVPISVMFSPIDGLFILLAVGAAYKFGSGQAQD